MTTNSIAMIGLGKMGGNMARRLARAGLQVQAFDAQLTKDASFEQSFASEANLHLHHSLETCALTQKAGKRLIWVMLPAGETTQSTLDLLLTQLAPGDLVVEGGNANYLESQARAKVFEAKGIHFVDCGVSGGIWGLENGYCLMYGGSPQAAHAVEAVMKALAVSESSGWLHCGASGAGHYSKMIHNGIEYGMMQALGEGFAMLDAKKEFEIDTARVAELWRHGSVVRSWLLDLTADALKQDPKLAGIKPVVADSGEGRWTAQEAVDLGIPTPVMSLALMMRFASQGQDEFGAKLLAKMRQGFGGHAVQKR